MRIEANTAKAEILEQARGRDTAAMKARAEELLKTNPYAAALTALYYEYLILPESMTKHHRVKIAKQRLRTEWHLFDEEGKRKW